MDAALAGRPRCAADALALVLLDEWDHGYESEETMLASWQALRTAAWAALRRAQAIEQPLSSG